MGKPARARHVVFTDLDGTVLDHHTYRPGPALGALGELQAHGVVVIPATSKTEAELRSIAAELGLRDGWIAENGGSAVIRGEPHEYGIPYQAVRQGLAEAALTVGASVRGFGDMDDATVARLSGLTVTAAQRARRRKWTETFELLDGDPAALWRELARRGLSVTRGGRFLTVGGTHDKGTAVSTLLRGLGARVTSWAVGDAPNDVPMLAAVEHPLLVRSHHGGWADTGAVRPTLLRGIGPLGFAEAARLILRMVDPRHEGV